jgi:hypothetical protein
LAEGEGRHLDVALFGGHTETTPKPVRLAWDELVETLSHHQRRQTREGPGWSCASYLPGHGRSKDGVDQVHALVLDFDHVEPDWGRLDGYTWAAHTSFKHRADHPDCGRRDCPHWRVVLPLATPVAAADWPRVWAQARSRLAPTVDRATKDASRFFWLPSCLPDAQPEVRAGTGRWLDPGDIPTGEGPEGTAPEDPGVVDEGKIPHGSQHTAAVSIAGALRKRGLLEGEIYATLAALRERFEVKKPDDLDHLRKVAKDAAGWDPGEVDWMLVTDGAAKNGDRPKAGAAGANIFTTVRGDPDAIEPSRYAWDDWVELGVWNVLVGAGNAGKGLLIAWLFAGLTRGTIPGELQDQPTNVLVVANEDGRHNTWDPRILAAGGDLGRVHYLAYADHVTPAQRVPFEFNKHCALLEETLVEKDIAGVYFDQVFDHFAPDANGNLPMDVRRQLYMVKETLGKHDRFGIYTCHPNKGHGKSLRDLVGGSHQLVELARNGLFLGYHPDEDGVRVLVRDKGNHSAAQVHGLRFEVESATQLNTKKNLLVPAGRLSDIRDEEDGLTLRDLSVDPVSRRDKGPTKEQQANAVIVQVAADGGLHPKRVAEDRCGELGISKATFDRAWETAPIVKEHDKTKRGSPVDYRLQRKEDE